MLRIKRNYGQFLLILNIMQENQLITDDKGFVVCCITEGCYSRPRSRAKSTSKRANFKCKHCQNVENNVTVYSGRSRPPSLHLSKTTKYRNLKTWEDKIRSHLEEYVDSITQVKVVKYDVTITIQLEDKKRTFSLNNDEINTEYVIQIPQAEFDQSEESINGTSILPLFDDHQLVSQLLNPVVPQIDESNHQFEAELENAVVNQIDEINQIQNPIVFQIDEIIEHDVQWALTDPELLTFRSILIDHPKKCEDSIVQRLTKWKIENYVSDEAVHKLLGKQCLNHDIKGYVICKEKKNGLKKLKILLISKNLISKLMKKK